MKQHSHAAVRYIQIVGWIAFLMAFFYFYLSRADFFRSEIQSAAFQSVALGYGVYLILGCVRGFTLLPSTSLVVAAIPVFPAVPLFVMTLAGILISSTSIYYFAERLYLGEVFERRHKEALERVTDALQRNQLSITVGWSFFPLVPTDVICYASGILRLPFLKFILGVTLGEGAICGVYILLGDSVFRYLHLRG